MAKNNQNKSSKAPNDLNSYEITGSVGKNSSEANNLIDKSMDAIRDNMYTKQLPNEKST